MSDRKELLTTWVHKYSDELFSWALHKTSNQATAEDIIQETFVSAFQHFDSFREASSPKTWLFSILKNKIIDYYRQKSRNVIAQNLTAIEDETAQWFDRDNRWKKEFRPEDWDTESENLLDNPEFESVLSNCVGKLPIAWSSCIQLKYLSEKDTADICQQLNITASNLWQILHRAKLHLRNCLERNWFKA